MRGQFFLGDQPILTGSWPLAQVLLVVGQGLLAQHFLDLRAHLIQRRELHRAGVVDLMMCQPNCVWTGLSTSWPFFSCVTA